MSQTDNYWDGQSFAIQLIQSRTVLFSVADLLASASKPLTPNAVVVACRAEVVAGSVDWTAGQFAVGSTSIGRPAPGSPSFGGASTNLATPLSIDASLFVGGDEQIAVTVIFVPI